MNRPTVLIGGGYDKNSDYKEWLMSFDGKVKELVLIGQTKEKIAEEARECGLHNITLADTFEEAMDVCIRTAKPGDAVLLSPWHVQVGGCLKITKSGEINLKKL